MPVPKPERTDDEHWQVIESCASELLTAYEDLRQCSELYDQLRRQQEEHYTAMDEEGIQAAQAQITQLIPRRRAAGERVKTACDGLDEQLLRLRKVLESEGAASPGELLNQLQGLSGQARTSQSVDVAHALRRCASDVRRELREARGQALRDLEAQVRETCDQLAALGEPATETLSFLEARPYLDRPLDHAQNRLRNELALLKSRIAEREQQLAAQSLESLEQQLTTGKDTTAEELENLAKLLEQAAEMEDRSRLVELGRQLAQSIAVAQLPFNTAFGLWRHVVRCFWEGTSAASRLESVVDSLPPPSSASPQDLLAKVQLLLIDARLAEEEPSEFWPVLEKLRAHEQPAWAQAFFTLLWKAPSPAALARWWLLFPKASVDPAQVEKVAAALPEVEAYAVRCWAAERVPHTVRLGLHPLLPRWLRRWKGCPSPQVVRQAFEFAEVGHDPAADALLAVLSVLTDETSLLYQGVLDRLRADGFETLAEHLETYLLTNRTELASLLERHRQRREATALLDSIGDQRNPGGGPAFEAWSSSILPQLNALRMHLSQPTHRADAERELASLKPKRVLDLACAEVDIPGVNPKAEVKITEWIETYKRYLPIATRPPVDLPASFLSPNLDAGMMRDTDRLARLGQLGTIACEYLGPLLEEPTQVLTAVEGPSFEEEARKIFGEEVSRPMLRWRFQLSTGPDWPARAGEDVLEELAGLLKPREVAARYLAQRRLDLAEQLSTLLGPADREAVNAEVQAALKQAREDTEAVLQSLLREPLEQALREGAQDDAALGQRMRTLLDQTSQLLQALPGLPVSQAEETSSQLLEETDAAIKDWEAFTKKRRQEIHEPLRRALDSFLHGKPVEGGSILAQALEAALANNLSEARRSISLLSLPKDHPLRANLSFRQPVSPSVRAQRIRPAQPVEPGALSRFTRQSWDRAEVPPGFSPVSLLSAGLMQPHEWQLALLRSAKKRYADKGEWRPLLARWALEEGLAQARDRGFGRAWEYARDATLLLASEPDSEDTRWTMDEVLSLWLAARLEGSHLARAREPLSWSELRNHLQIAFLVRCFVEYRGLDVLSEVAVEVSGIGGLALSRLLAPIGENEHHLRGLLLREVIRGGTSLSHARLVVIVDLFLPWLSSERAARLEELLSQWSGAGLLHSSEERLPQTVRFLQEAGVPPELRSRFEEAFHQRMLSQRTQPADTRFSCNLTTSLIYLSSAEESPEGIQLVADVAYRGGLENAPDLKLAISLEHPTLTVESVHKIQEVGLLRPDDVKDIVFPVVSLPGNARGAEASNALVTLLLYREDARGKSEQISRRKFSVNVAASYPHQDAPTPYITGKCINELSMFKGRNKEVEEILDKLHGEHVDNFVLIYGMRRIGKSSLLQRLSLDARFRKYYEMVHLDLELHLKSDDTPATLLQKFASHIREEIADPQARALDATLRNEDCYKGFHKYLEGISKVLAPKKRLLLLFDEFQMLFVKEYQARYEDLIKTLRHWIQYLTVGFVVAGTYELKSATLGPGQRLFQLGLPVELKALDEKAARELIRDPVANYFHVTGPAAQLILEETDRLPNLIQIVCHQLFLHMRERQQTVATHRDVLDVLQAVSRSDEHFSFLLNPAGAEPLRKVVIRALAELGVDEKRGTTEEIRDHLQSHGYGKALDGQALDECLQWLSEHNLTFNWKGELRLRPALLARHVLQRKEYQL
ncbi:ATP-binding protein [Hyalangium gracile]|uniref:ATP-binding protein n=1 Tax=Hyalangium gracile TaxID=394092 RepID=UPI001CCFA04E|nr:ATP-binding protein [Hyalangium gracile]